jgi:hypothetical protein
MHFAATGDDEMADENPQSMAEGVDRGTSKGCLVLNDTGRPGQSPAAERSIRVRESTAYVAVSRYLARGPASRYLMAQIAERDAPLAKTFDKLSPAVLDLYHGVATVHLLGEPVEQLRRELLQRLLEHLAALAVEEFGEPLGPDTNFEAIVGRFKAQSQPGAPFERTLIVTGDGAAVDIFQRSED